MRMVVALHLLTYVLVFLPTLGMQRSFLQVSLSGRLVPPSLKMVPILPLMGTICERMLLRWSHWVLMRMLARLLLW